jgi:hypothetical protein
MPNLPCPRRNSQYNAGHMDATSFSLGRVALATYELRRARSRYADDTNRLHYSPRSL